MIILQKKYTEFESMNEMNWEKMLVFKVIFYQVLNWAMTPWKMNEWVIDARATGAWIKLDSIAESMNEINIVIDERFKSWKQLSNHYIIRLLYN